MWGPSVGFGLWSWAPTTNTF